MIEAIKLHMSNNTKASNRIQSSGISDMFTLPILALVNLHIEAIEPKLIDPVRWHPQGDLDLQVQVKRAEDMQRVWIKNGSRLLPAYVVKDELKGKFEDYLKTHDPVSFEEKPEFREKHSGDDFDTWWDVVPKFYIKPADAKPSDKLEVAVGHTHKDQPRGRSKKVYSRPSSAKKAAASAEKVSPTVTPAKAPSAKKRSKAAASPAAQTPGTNSRPKRARKDADFFTPG